MDAQEKEIAVFFCPDCDTEICCCVIERIRKQENAMIAAKQAIESMDTLNKKLTKEKDLLVAELKKWKEKARKELKKDIDDKRSFIDQRFEKLMNRGKLIQ